MFVRDVMTKDVVIAAPDASIRQVAQMMSRIDSGAIPIINSEILGIVTDRDIVLRAVAEGLDLDGPVSEIMTSGIESCLEDDDLREASRRMSELQMRRLLVFDHDGNVSGILSLGDMAVLNEELAGVTLEEISDDEEVK
ncbi:CBS domain-containing protein [Rhizobium sp. S152]|uniref:CBS domain-containing protein n=1 Tax=Rhizobium sp. S152 TaxID=3055038 RepID=UPI0025A94641|nr:CBS domain-containing protein [Rhizobium sp. S152]MDM9627709.1 CBS domain-containing protein [Rhizobium sp. S152]